jgi:hypothetical protein
MQINLPHWAAIVVMVLGATVLGSAQIASLAAYSVLLTTVGSTLLAAGTTGILKLPSISAAANIGAVAKLDNAVPKVQAAIAKAASVPPPRP